MKRYIRGLFLESGEASLSRLVSFFSLLIFLWALWMSFYSGRIFDAMQQQILLTILGVSGTGTAILPLANKAINAAYNSPLGQYISKFAPEEYQKNKGGEQK